VRSMKRTVWAAVAMCVVTAALFLAVFPTRTYLSQRREKNALTEQVRSLRKSNAALDHRVDELQTDTEIERLARSQYNLVRPGEEAYALLPAPVKAPPPAPAKATQPDRGLLARAWHTVTNW
jgi:cell division protein FtsB